MDFFDNAINTAKDAFEIAYQKTDEIVTVQKQKFDVAAIKTKRTKDFQKLGSLYFNKMKDSEIEDEEIKALVEEIKRKNKQIDELNKEINSAKGAKDEK